MFKSEFYDTNHLCRFYGHLVCTAFKKKGMVIAQEMSMVKYVAILSVLKITGAGERILARNLQKHLGNSFCTTQMAIPMLIHAEIHTDSKGLINQGKKIEETVE
jgi:hypothetical protein